MANDPENPKYQQYLARLERALQSRFPMTIIVAIAVVTVVAILVFAKALPRRSPSARPELLTTTTQSGAAQLSEQSPAEVLQPQQTRQQGQMPVAAGSPEINHPRDEGRSSAQGSDSLRSLSALQQQLDQVKQAQEEQIQTIANQLELITKQQETSLQAASRMAAQIVALSQKATAISTQHQESVRTIAAIEAKLGNAQASQEVSPSSAPLPTPAPSPTGAASHRHDNNNNNNKAVATVAARGAAWFGDLPLPAGVSTTALSNGWQFNFDSAIFVRDDYFKIGAKPRLRAVAQALVQSRQEVIVQVVGLADAEPNTWPWLEPRAISEMALLRACRVSTYLESLGIFPPGTVLPRAGSAEDLPFPAGDTNNRTVVLRIFPETDARRH